MLSVSKLRNRPRHFSRLVGLSVSEFDTLLEAVEASYEPVQKQRLSRSNRVRGLGGGRHLGLSLEHRLLSTLLFYRLHVTGLLLSFLFDLDESNLWRERNWRMMPVLLEVLPTPMQNHLLSTLEKPKDNSKDNSKERPRKRIGSLQELLSTFPELRDICVDATEQEVPKPQNRQDKKFFYSGKAHCHTVKTQITSAGRLVLHVMGGTPGAVADRQVLKASGVIPALSQAPTALKTKVCQGKRPPRLTVRRVRLDRGYSGIEKEYPTYPRVQILAALKGTSRSKVTPLGKIWNQRMVSRGRIQVEQNIGHLKNWRVLSGIYRAAVSTHEPTVRLVAGLHNFTILGQLQWEK